MKKKCTKHTKIIFKGVGTTTTINCEAIAWRGQRRKNQNFRIGSNKRIFLPAPYMVSFSSFLCISFTPIYLFCFIFSTEQRLSTISCVSNVHKFSQNKKISNKPLKIRKKMWEENEVNREEYKNFKVKLKTQGSYRFSFIFFPRLSTNFAQERIQTNNKLFEIEHSFVHS